VEAEYLHELTPAYALDALDAHDEGVYEEHLRTCSHCREELGPFREAAAALAYGVTAPAPRSDLRERIVDQARTERATVVPLRRRWVPQALGAAAAVAASAAIGLGIWAASLHNDLGSTRSALSDERAAAAVLADPAAERTDVSGAEGALIVARDGRAVLSLKGIPRAPEGKAYEIWVIRGKTPRPAGLFGAAGSKLLERPVPQGAIVAVTLEQEEGVDAPTETPRYTAKT
jgi:anti-sigma factor RsiW